MAISEAGGGRKTVELRGSHYRSKDDRPCNSSAVRNPRTRAHGVLYVLTYEC